VYVADVACQPNRLDLSGYEARLNYITPELKKSVESFDAKDFSATTFRSLWNSASNSSGTGKLGHQPASLDDQEPL
jgi:hypothetical protein